MYSGIVNEKQQKERSNRKGATMWGEMLHDRQPTFEIAYIKVIKINVI